jgi:hypothetical protein
MVRHVKHSQVCGEIRCHTLFCYKSYTKFIATCHTDIEDIKHTAQSERCSAFLQTFCGAWQLCLQQPSSCWGLPSPTYAAELLSEHQQYLTRYLSRLRCWEQCSHPLKTCHTLPAHYPGLHLWLQQNQHLAAEPQALSEAHSFLDCKFILGPTRTSKCLHVSSVVKATTKSIDTNIPHNLNGDVQLRIMVSIHVVPIASPTATY